MAFISTDPVVSEGGATEILVGLHTDNL